MRGASGTGKTALPESLTGLLKQGRGHVLFNAMDMASGPEPMPHETRVMSMPHEPPPPARRPILASIGGWR